jgi:hypothetical protein
MHFLLLLVLIGAVVRSLADDIVEDARLDTVSNDNTREVITIDQRSLCKDWVAEKIWVHR